MAYEHKPGSFALFKNDKKGNEKAPDYRGMGKDLEGSDIEVAAWIREGGKGKFMSCTFKLKRERPQAPRREAAPKDGGMDVDNEIPW